MKKIFILLVFLFSCKSPVGGKINEISKSFLNTPYLLNPLGEEGGIDKDPLYRFDKFDCVTYVETVLALSKTNNEEDFKKLLNEIRFANGEIEFTKRNHFFQDWLNNNTNHVEDITEEISQKTLNTSPSVSNVIIDKKAWLKKRYNIESNYEPYDLNVNYIDIDKIISNKDKFITTITEPMIVNFVIHNPKLKEKIGTDVNISHTGFLIPHNNSIVLRHASSYKKKVNEIDIFEYLKKIRKHQEYKGLNFLEIKP